MVTIKDIAKYSQSSISSVSRALQNQNGVRPELRAQILRTARDLDYKPLRVHQRNPLHLRILLVAPRPTAVTWAIYPLLETLKKVANEEQFLYDLLLLDIDLERDFTAELARKHIQTKFSIDKTKGQLVQTKKKNTASMAVILFNVNPSDDAVAYLKQQRIPSVLLQNTHPQLKSFLSNEEQGIFASCHHLKKRGYKRVFFAGWQPEDFCLKQRYKYFLEAVKHFSLELEADFYADLDIAGGRKIAKSLLRHHKLQKDAAVFCAADILAIGFYEIARQNMLEPGRDFGLMGYDNMDFSQVIGLSTVEQFVPYKLKIAVTYLLDELNQKEGSEEDYRGIELRLSPKLIIRRTT